MNIALLIVLGFMVSFIGTIPPSMLNMTTAKISLDTNKSQAVKFAYGVSLIIFVQAYLALVFAKYIHNSLEFNRSINLAAGLIFLFLSFYFFFQARKEKRLKEASIKNKPSPFIYGFILASLNMFAIPFYCGVGSTLNSAGWLPLDNLSILFFVIGSTLGTFSLLMVYANTAEKIQKKAAFLSKNLNYALSLLTATIAIVTLSKLI